MAMSIVYRGTFRLPCTTGSAELSRAKVQCPSSVTLPLDGVSRSGGFRARKRPAIVYHGHLAVRAQLRRLMGDAGKPQKGFLHGF
jgi:hypothetical protein